MGFQHGSNSVVTRWTVLKGWRSEFTVGPSHVFLMFLLGELVEHRCAKISGFAGQVYQIERGALFQTSGTMIEQWRF